jgi:5-methylcytosine-specific restriction endonuclease McrA
MGRSIIGATRLIRHLKDKAKARTVDPRKKHREYRSRDRNLPDVGYAGYQEYLRSPEWSAIRSEVLRRLPQCLLCESPASCVHHMSYDTRVILGLDRRTLVALCERCHQTIEFDGKRKRSLREANGKLRFLASQSGLHGWLQKNKRALDALKKPRRQKTG